MPYIVPKTKVLVFEGVGLAVLRMGGFIGKADDIVITK